jgi:hypothetical protein
MTMKINDNGTNRDMTETEIAEHETRQKTCADEAKAQAKFAADKATAKATLLVKLNISADEAALLINY